MVRSVELTGIDAICSFAEQKVETLMDWRMRYGFPLWKDGVGNWASSRKKIEKWYNDRGVNPKTITRNDLQRFEWFRRKKEIAARNKSKLVGIEAIEAFSEQEFITLNNWRLDFDFPMWKDAEGLTWLSTRDKIIRWYEERGVDAKSVTEKHLKQYEFWKMKNLGQIKPLKKTLNGINELVAFSGCSFPTVQDWYMNFVDCPIKKHKDGTLYADADEFLEWMSNTIFKESEEANGGT